MATDELSTRLLRLLRQYRRLGAGPERTIVAKRIAEGLIDFRARHVTSSNQPDWRGSTAAYKRAVGELFEQAGFDKSAVPGAVSAIGYHVGNALRSRLSEPELVTIGSDDALRLASATLSRMRCYRESTSTSGTT